MLFTVNITRICDTLYKTPSTEGRGGSLALSLREVICNLHDSCLMQKAFHSLSRYS